MCCSHQTTLHIVDEAVTAVRCCLKLTYVVYTPTNLLLHVPGSIAGSIQAAATPGAWHKCEAEPAVMPSAHCCCRYEAALQKATEAAAALRPGVKRDPEPKEEVIGDDDDDEDLQVGTCRVCV